MILGCGGSDPKLRHDLENLTYTEVLTRLPSPKSETEFYLDTTLAGIRQGLRHKISEDKRPSTRIKELSWSQGSCNLVVWFIESDSGWVSIEALQWNPKTIKF